MSTQEAIARLEEALDRLDAAARHAEAAMARLAQREAGLSAAAVRALADLDALLARAEA